MLLVFLSLFVFVSLGYNNGMGKYPALGWNTWCTTWFCGSDLCSEQQVKDTANAILNKENLNFSIIILLKIVKIIVNFAKSIENWYLFCLMVCMMLVMIT